MSTIVRAMALSQAEKTKCVAVGWRNLPQTGHTHRLKKPFRVSLCIRLEGKEKDQKGREQEVGRGQSPEAH